jgi:hypothetical protein
LALLIRLAGRLAHATVDDPGGRHLGQPCGSAKPWAAPASAAAKLADLYAERALLGGAWPALLDKALAETPALLRSPRPTPTTRRQRSALAALQVLAAPKSAAAQEALILARGAERTWCPPLAGQDGRRYLNPHTVVARDAVARLVLLAPRHAQGRLWKRYLESAPGGQPVRLGTLALTVQRSRREVLKKDDTQVFHVTLTVKNEDPDRPARLRPAGFRLHGAAATPRAAGLWKPDLREPVPAGQTVTLELTFAAPLGPAPATLVLSAPRAGAGSAWLQISSAVLP